MNGYVADFIRMGLAFAVGVAVGSFYTFHRDSMGKIRVKFETKTVWTQVAKTTAYIVIVVTFLGSILQSVLFTYDQRQCNNDVVASLQERSLAAQEIEKINNERDKAMRDFVTAILSAQSQPDSSERVRAALQQHFSVTQQLNKAYEAQQQQLRTENPLPEC